MNDRRKSEPGAEEFARALIAVASRPLPGDFARRTTARFEATVAKRRRRRLIIAITTTCLLGMAGAWALLLDAFGLTGAIRDSLIDTAVVMDSLMTLWSHLPTMGVLFSVGLMALVLLNYALLSKLGNGAGQLDR